MVVNRIDKKAKMNEWQIVKYQLLTHCYLEGVQLSDTELNCLTHLCLEGEQELTSFCNHIFFNKLFSSSQSARNCVVKLEKKGMIVKEGKNKKKIFVNPSLNIQVKGNILLDFKFLSLAQSQEV